MRIYTLITILMLYVGNAAADNQKLLDSLDTVISHKAQFVAEKENRISSLKRRLSKGMKGETALQTLNDLYEEYHSSTLPWPMPTRDFLWQGRNTTIIIPPFSQSTAPRSWPSAAFIPRP